jgi:AcrR family transcriptional regulator
MKAGRRSWIQPREEILDIAAGLFVDQGIAATSTRDIAEAVGVRQSSLYYHYPSGKDEMLAELLQRSIRPTLDKIEKIEALSAEPDATPEVLLYLLVTLDVMEGLHEQWMDLPGPTDVMAFPMDELDGTRRPDAVESSPALLGDIMRRKAIDAIVAAMPKESIVRDEDDGVGGL